MHVRSAFSSLGVFFSAPFWLFLFGVLVLASALALLGGRWFFCAGLRVLFFVRAGHGPRCPICHESGQKPWILWEVVREGCYGAYSPTAIGLEKPEDCRGAFVEFH